MLVCLRLDPRQVRGWHRLLRDRIAAQPGTRVICVLGTGRLVSALAEPLLRLEGALRRRSQGPLAALIGADALPAVTLAATAPDLTIDLTGAVPSDPHAWSLAADDGTGEDALWRAVLSGRCPVVEVRSGSRVLAAGRIGTESKGLLIESLEDALARTVTLFITALSGAPPSTPAVFPSAVPPPLDLPRAAGLAVGVVRRRLASRLYRLAYRTPQWRIGWRTLTGPDLIGLRRQPDGGWHDLPDDSLRFYADPFPLVRDGSVTLFMEEYPHDTGRGVIAAVRFGPDGPVGTPEPVLERPHHLSYPFVFERDGEAWMIPESAESGTIDLYRATRFPGGWVREATLVSGVDAGDATLHEADGRWWMFAVVRDGGAASDMLCLWSAPDFRGPWRAHPKNPVLVDVASARPAGRMVMRDGALIRPVQDCRNGYGAALGLATVTRLDDDGFAQRLDTVLTPGPRWPGHAFHTLNAAGGFEFIDGSGKASRLRRAGHAASTPQAAPGTA